MIYGLTQGFSAIGTAFVALFISGCFGCLPAGIAFLVLFCPLRIYAGGYHADTRVKCFLSSVVAEIIIFAAVKYVMLPEMYCVMAIITATIIIGMMAPQDNPNKRLDSVESKIYRRKTLYYLVVHSLVCLLGFSLGNMKMVNIVVYVQWFQAILLVVGKAKK